MNWCMFCGGDLVLYIILGFLMSYSIFSLCKEDWVKKFKCEEMFKKCVSFLVVWSDILWSILDFGVNVFID